MKIKSSVCTALFAFFLIPVLSLSAMDAGLLLEGNASTNDQEESELFMTALPWVSMPLGAGIDMYISGSFKADYEKNKTENEKKSIAYILPELLRTELTIRWDGGEFKAGRVYYSDPFGFITRGYFDGARIVLDVGGGSLGIGAWYTGFLYKKSAQITMTESELDSYNAGFDSADFWNTYFAPSRFIGALDWENPSKTGSTNMRIALIAQYDLSGSESFYHSQYLMMKVGIPLNELTFNLGACIEMSEIPDMYHVSYAWEMGIAWVPPVPFPNMLTLSGRYSSGKKSEHAAFVPITTEPQGGILKAKFSGLSIIRLDYTARFHKTFSLGLQSSCFILNDHETYQGRPTGKEGDFLGSELYGFLVWSPVSDVRFRGGGGVFLPSLGNADPNGKKLWGVELGFTLAVF
jgi:hypothetical protein